MQNRTRAAGGKRSLRHAAHGLAVLLSVGFGASSALALQPGKLGDKPVDVDVTEAGSFIYNFDNRNFRPGKVDTATDDKWGMFYNRLNLQSSWGRWQLGLRLDSAWFYTAPTAKEVARRMVDHQPAGTGSAQDYYDQEGHQALNDLSTRYQNIIYPSKYYLGYTTPDFEATVGDVYAQLGRGLVLSVRKIDELSSDTTIRGARLTGRVKADGVRLKLTGIGGALNPLRIDEASGRILSVDPSYGEGPFAGQRIAEAGMPRPASDHGQSYVGPTYSTDRLAGGELDVKTRHVAVGYQAARLIRHYPIAGDVSQFPEPNVTNFSQSIGIPDFDGHGAGYVEVAYQHRDHPGVAHVVDPGYAVYGSLSVIQRPVTVLLEMKHYRRFFALKPNRLNRAATKEFQIVQYSTPPTTEPIWEDAFFNYMTSCITGGRLRTDVEASDNDTLFGWVGRYDTWAASSAVNQECKTGDDRLDRIWDFAVGLEKTAHHHRSRATITVGARDHEANQPFIDAHGNRTRVLYRENYVRYDIIEYIHGPFSLQLQGWHRHRVEPRAEGEAWFEGEHLTGFQWAPHIVVAFGVEYDTRSTTPNMYYNGQVRYNFNSSSSVSAFVGERRGSLRCVSGVCRFFPPFEGARLDATLRF
jgi:hypothetical protein